MLVYSLNGKWDFRVAGPLRGKIPRNLELDRWLPAHMPGTLHYHLWKQGKIRDPFYGRNELDVQWVDEQDWELRKIFWVKASDCEKTRKDLIFGGIDAVGDIFLNGKEVGRSTNMFRQVVCDTRGVLKSGKNEIRILLKSPTNYAKKEARRNRFLVDTDREFKGETGEVRETRRVWIRKAQCHFGWDGGVYLAVSGLWKPAWLECSDAPRFASIQTLQFHLGSQENPAHVKLKFTIRLESRVPSEGFLEVSCGGITTLVSAKLKIGENILNAELALNRPRIWWPEGQGEQYLYPLKVIWKEAGGETVQIEKRLGLRTVELVTRKDRSPKASKGESFYFKINGQPVFMKGADWIPVDAMVDRCTRGIYRHLLKSMAETHMNMVRVWGGGWYELDVFYDLCDEMGILIWQDFMMACAVYPDTSSFLLELSEEVKFQVRRLGDHPCIALWCGDNENVSGLNHWWDKVPNGHRYSEIYRKVMTTVQKVCKAEDPDHPFWLSSPSNGIFQGEPDDLNRGDVYYRKVWHGGKPFSDYLTVKPRFVSEFGFQFFPEYRTISSVVPTDEMNPSSWSMEHHQRSPNGNMLIANTLAREMPILKDFESFCLASQINQSVAIRTAVEHWRRAKPWCMGALFWQLNDLWPVASWSSIDYYGRWKVLPHEAERFFASLMASIVPKNESLEIWATSDIPKPLQLKVTWKLLCGTAKEMAGFQ